MKECETHVCIAQIRHVLVERDILASTSSPWLVRLLYAFQDPEHVFLAMVRRDLYSNCRWP